MVMVEAMNSVGFGRKETKGREVDMTGGQTNRCFWSSCVVGIRGNVDPHKYSHIHRPGALVFSSLLWCGTKGTEKGRKEGEVFIPLLCRSGFTCWVFSVFHSNEYPFKLRKRVPAPFFVIYAELVWLEWVCEWLLTLKSSEWKNISPYISLPSNVSYARGLVKYLKITAKSLRSICLWCIFNVRHQQLRNEPSFGFSYL